MQGFYYLSYSALLHDELFLFDFLVLSSKCSEFFTIIIPGWNAWSSYSI